MKNKILYLIVVLIIVLVFSNSAFASLTFTTDAITGTTASSIDLGSGNDLFLQTSGGKVGVGTTDPGSIWSFGGTVIGPSVLTLKNTNDIADAFDIYDNLDRVIFQLNKFGNLGLFRHTANTNAAGFNVRRDRNGAKVEQNDTPFIMSALPYDGSAYRDMASIVAIVDGVTINSTAVPTGWAFKTGPLLSSIERMRITSSGNIGINTQTPLSKLGIVGNVGVGANYGIISAPTSGMIIEGNLGIGTTDPTQKLEINGGIRLNTITAKPVCDATTRGTTWYVASGAGIADSIEICGKSAADAYSWVALASW